MCPYHVSHILPLCLAVWCGRGCVDVCVWVMACVHRCCWRCAGDALYRRMVRTARQRTRGPGFRLDDTIIQEMQALQKEQREVCIYI